MTKFKPKFKQIEYIFRVKKTPNLTRSLHCTNPNHLTINYNKMGSS